jgi:hypothetical protein
MKFSWHGDVSLVEESRLIHESLDSIVVRLQSPTLELKMHLDEDEWDLYVPDKSHRMFEVTVEELTWNPEKKFWEKL